MPEVIVRRQGAVGTVVLSNPAKFNAMSLSMWQALPPAIAELDDDPAIRVIVLEGDGDRAFVSGADISQFESNRTEQSARALYETAVDAGYRAPIENRKPTIAKIRGICMGGGLGLAASCDLRICADDTRFRMPAARLGLGYSTAGTARFLALVGPQRTLELFYTARIFGAADALAMGFVLQVTPAAELDATVAALAESIAANAPLTQTAAKRSMDALLYARGAPVSPEAVAQKYAAAREAVQACGRSEDYREGARAFMEKRPPQFMGR
jgi:enoyl-CoA hydratase/carnithine racemase